MHSSALLVPALAAVAQASWMPSFNSAVASTASITKRCAGEELPKAQYSLPLSSKVKRPKYKHAAYENLLSQLSARQVGSYNETVSGSDFDEEYVAKVTIGGQDFELIVDTGSSDTWVIQTGFHCYNLSDVRQDQSECAFSYPYQPTKSKTYVEVPDENFNISYADGEYLTGTVALETVEIAGMKVTNQTIGVVTDAAWQGDSVSSGLMGLAYPELTSTFTGDDPTQDNFGANSSNWHPYNPLFYNAVNQSALDAPIFSLALNRGTFSAMENSTFDEHLGYIAFGGIAPVNVTNTSAVTPIVKYKTSSGSDYYYYTIKATYAYEGTLNHTQEAILDSGTTLNYLPNWVAKKFNAGFKPAATFDESSGLFFVDCNATAPDFAVVIEGQEFTIDGRDQILPAGTDDNGKEVCISGTQLGGTGASGSIFVLGDVFWHNVVVTFSLAHEEVTITARTPY